MVVKNFFDSGTRTSRGTFRSGSMYAFQRAMIWATLSWTGGAPAAGGSAATTTASTVLARNTKSAQAAGRDQRWGIDGAWRSEPRRVKPETGGFGVDNTFEATGNVRVMQQAVEAAREAWGLATMIGVAGKGETLDVVPRLLITGRRVTGSSFGGV